MISIVIPVKNGGRPLQRCLEAIRSQEVDDEVETIVVDSGSSDGTQDLAKSFGAHVHEIPPSEFNHGETRNVGARLARGDIVVFTVDDALPVSEDWLARLVHPLRSEPEVVGAYSRQIAYDNAPPHQAFYIDYRYGPEPRVQRATADAELSVGNVLFSNVSSAIRRSALEEFPFASDVVIAEDLEWCTRVLLSGHQVAYVPDSVVRHSHVYSATDTIKRYFDQGAAADRSFLGSGRTSPAAVRGEGARYVRRELGWMWSSGYRGQIPEALAHEIARYTGFRLGVNHRRVPRFVKARISRTSVYWSD